LVPEFEFARTPLLTVQVDPPSEGPQYQMIPLKRHHELVFVYLTYSPPGTALVSFKCVAVDTIEERFFVLDEICSWLKIGENGRDTILLW
jgi:hypothetical protein